MRRYARPLVVGATVLALGVAGTMAASAWTVPAKKVTVKVRAAKMPKGITPSAGPQGHNAMVSWSAQEILPGVRMTSYVVAAEDVSAAHHAGISHTVRASGSDLESSTFTAAELGTGRWRWTITPHFENWAGVESRPSAAVTSPVSAASALADTVTAMAASVAAPAVDPASAPIEPAPAAPTTSSPPTPETPATPATSATEKEPAKTESPKAGPTPSDIPSGPPSTIESAAE
jgi:hypothetical protein